MNWKRHVWEPQCSSTNVLIQCLSFGFYLRTKHITVFTEDEISQDVGDISPRLNPFFTAFNYITCVVWFDSCSLWTVHLFVTCGPPTMRPVQIFAPVKRKFSLPVLANVGSLDNIVKIAAQSGPAVWRVSWDKVKCTKIIKSISEQIKHFGLICPVPVLSVLQLCCSYWKYNCGADVLILHSFPTKDLFLTQRVLWQNNVNKAWICGEMRHWTHTSIYILIQWHVTSLCLDIKLQKVLTQLHWGLIWQITK